MQFFRTTPQCQVPSLDHQEMGLTTSPGSPLTRARNALLLATNHQEMSLTTSPGSPLTRAKKALLLGKQNWSACAVYFFLLIITELVWLNLYGLSCMAFEPYYDCVWTFSLAMPPKCINISPVMALNMYELWNYEWLSTSKICFFCEIWMCAF